MKRIDPKNRLQNRIQRMNLAERLTDDTFRYYFQLLLVSLVLGFIAVVMTVMNVFTGKYALMTATGSFSLASFVNAAVMLRRRKITAFNRTLFFLSIFALFVYFLITGGTAGFSPHWILMLPMCGMMILGMGRGLIISGIMFLVTIFLLWFPAGKSLLQYAYTPEFCMRFPMVYIAFYAIAFCAESIRLITHRELIRTRDKLTHISEIDYLTQIHNRQWFNRRLERMYARQTVRHDGVMLLVDIDDFKRVNDTYGHEIGDIALVSIAKAIADSVGEEDMLCRWGGEEFFLYLPDCDEHRFGYVNNRIHSNVRAIIMRTETGVEFGMTVSIGAVRVAKGESLEADGLFIAADQALYMAKKNGKNRTEFAAVAATNPEPDRAE